MTTMKKLLRFILPIIVVGFLSYNSVYIKKLSDVKKDVEKSFDAAIFVKGLWEEKMPVKIDSAVDLHSFIQAIATDKEAALNKYSNALGIGNYRYAFIKTNATVSTVKEDELLIQIPTVDSVTELILATEYIYGNAIRDASGLVDVKDFPNTMDLNNISEELNKMVRKTVLPQFKAAVKKGDKVIVSGAIEIHKEHIKWNELEIIPVQLQIVQ